MTDNITDQGLAELMANLGYPDPQSTNKGRTIWSGRKSTILPSRTCSAFWGTTTVSSPEIRQIVHEVYSQYLSLPADQTAEQRTRFLDQETERISRRVAELAADLGERAISDWQTSSGQHPDFPTKTGLLNTARSSAMEIVLQEELYEQIPPPPEEPIAQDEAPIVDRATLPWDQRWTRTAYRTEPDETLEDLAETVWPDPDFTVLFRIKAGYLLAARAEDGHPLPSQPGEHLATQLAAMVYDDLESDGLPRQ